MMLRLAAVAAVALVSVPALAQSDVPGAEGPVHGRLIWTESPQTRVTVAWSTWRPGAAHTVHWDTESRGADPAKYRFSSDSQTNGKFSSAEREIYYHHAAIDGLRPDTTYYLVMQSDGAVSRELHFRTAPDADESFAVIHGGDSRSSRVMRREMNALIAKLTADDESLLALCHGGDYVYYGASLRQWISWMTDHELTVAPNGRMLPIVPTRGNHEAKGPLFDQVFASPGGGLGKNYFVTEFSPQVAMVTLNTEVAAGGNQLEFLSKSLAEQRVKRWLLVQYHRPIWPAVKLPSRAKTHWQPAFDKHRVDLACESDGHVLKRTPPIRGDKAHPDGVVYIGEGGLGVKQRKPFMNRWFLKPPGHASSDHHVWVLRFASDALTMRAITPEGEVADEHALHPRS